VSKQLPREDMLRPPKGTRYISFRITRDDGRHEIAISRLSLAEISWIADLLTIERERKLAMKTRTQKLERMVTMMVPRRLNNNETT
jgi:hypothetical protein